MQTKRKKQKKERWLMNSVGFPLSHGSVSLEITKEEEAKVKWKGWIIYIQEHPKHTRKKE